MTKPEKGLPPPMSNDDVIHRFRLALFARAGEVGVSQACREFGVHRSTYYRWHQKVQQWGLDALRPRERRPPRMPNQTPPWIEQRVVAFALGYPGFGPRRIAAELARPRWGGIVLGQRCLAHPPPLRPQPSQPAPRPGCRPSSTAGPRTSTGGA
ncbi:MAG: helix-turn-helix domain-containing protein [Dehalococcoidia bacterium]